MPSPSPLPAEVDDAEGQIHDFAPWEGSQADAEEKSGDLPCADEDA